MPDDRDEDVEVEVVVTARRVVHDEGSGGWNYFSPPYSNFTSPFENGSHFAYDIPYAASDASQKLVLVNIDRPLTSLERAAIEHLSDRIKALDKAISSLDDRATYNLHGQNVTGAEIKQLWAAADYVINEHGIQYSNGTSRGSADYNGGNPIVTFDIKIISDYYQTYGDAGLNFLLAHELSHVTTAGVIQNIIANNVGLFDPNEQFANDLQHALLTTLGIDTISNPNPTGIYTDPNGVFQTPPSYSELNDPWLTSIDFNNFFESSTGGFSLAPGLDPLFIV
ncbi:MAG: hypothetical protein C0509_08600 [Acinetobacter sp.]|nr:hypothetical protein [Acinetobacter sp.]